MLGQRASARRVGLLERPGEEKPGASAGKRRLIGGGLDRARSLGLLGRALRVTQGELDCGHVGEQVAHARVPGPERRLEQRQCLGLATPRILYSMAERAELPAALARVHPRFRTPDVSIYAFAAGGLAFGLAGGFAANATLSAIVRLVTYAVVCASLPVFRRRSGLEAPGFRLPAGDGVALLGIAFCAYLLSTRIFTQAWVLLALMAGGFGLWAASRQRARGIRQV